MKRRGTYLKITSIAVVLILLVVAFQPVVAAKYTNEYDLTSDGETRDEIPGPFRNLRQLVIDLIDATPQPQKGQDGDDDGLPDNVEWAIGADFTRADSDFDRLDDYLEVMNNMDPTQPDSNHDGLGDYYEVTNVDPDADGDGIPNVWDWDNDDAGAYDEMDISP